MAVSLQSLLEGFAARWPLEGAESWDAPGLVSGSNSQSVAKVLLTVDVTAAVLDHAIETGANLIFAHHPYIMRGVTTLAEETAKGALLTRAIRANVAIYAAHTNADIVTDGVSDVIARALGLQSITALDDTSNLEGHGRVGVLPDAMTLGDFARLVARVFPSTATGVRVAGDYNQMVEKVALCGGAGDSFIPAAINAKADVYLSSDLRHHVVQDARESALLSGGPAIVDIAHWAAEWLWLNQAATELRKIYPDVDFEVCDLNTDPWDFVITQ